MKRTFGAALVVALLVPVVALASTSAPRTAQATKLVVAVSSGYQALKDARAQGVFSDAGLDVSFVAMGSAKGVAQAVNGGGAQFGIIDPCVAMQQVGAKGLSLLIVSGAETYTAKSYAVVAGGSVADAAGLYQQTIAVPELVGVAHVATAVWLDTAGADSSSTKWKRVATRQLGEALSSGSVGAAVGPAASLKGTSLGDPITESFGAGAPFSVAIAGAEVDQATAKTFVAALAGVKGFTTKLNMEALGTEAESVGNYGYTSDQPDLDALVWKGAPRS